VTVPHLMMRLNCYEVLDDFQIIEYYPIIEKEWLRMSVVVTLIQSLWINSRRLKCSFVATPSKSICHGRVHDGSCATQRVDVVQYRQEG
jgi:5-methylthioribose kinase